jgi:Carboxypeptidase regulatory-like domain
MHDLGTSTRVGWRIAYSAALIIAWATCASEAAIAAGVSPTHDRSASNALTLSVAAGAEVTGRATDADGRPIAGAQIEFYGVPLSLGHHYRTRSGSDGKYAIDLPDGAYNVKAGYYSQDDSGRSGHYVDLVADDESSSPIMVPPGGTVDFRVP